MEKKMVLAGGIPAHRECLDRYNSTIMCGLEHGRCTSHECRFSKNFDEFLGWLAVEKEIAACRLEEGKPLQDVEAVEGTRRQARFAAVMAADQDVFKAFNGTGKSWLPKSWG